MPTCCFKKCLHRNDDGFKFFHLPRDSIRRSQWIRNIRALANGPGWNPSIHCDVCEIHFDPSDFEHDRDQIPKDLKLRAHSVPSRYSPSIPKRERPSGYLTKILRDNRRAILRESLIQRRNKLLVLFATTSSSTSNSTNSDSKLYDNYFRFYSNPIIPVQSTDIERIERIIQDLSVPEIDAPNFDLVIPSPSSIRVIKPLVSTTDFDEHNYFQRQMENTKLSSTKVMIFQSREDEDEEMETKYKAIAPKVHSSNKDFMLLPVVKDDHEEDPLSRIESMSVEIQRLQREKDALLRQLGQDQDRIKTLECEKRTLNTRLNQFLNQDQIQSLQQQKKKKQKFSGNEWSNDTIMKANELLKTCGSDGYQTLLNQGYPLPSIDRLRKE